MHRDDEALGPAEVPVNENAAVDPRTYLKVVGLGALIGVPAGLLAAGFLALVHQLENLLWTDLPDELGYTNAPWFLVIGLPALGAVLVIAARALLPGDGGHEPLKGLSMAPTPVSYGPGVVLAALGTLSFGAVLGPEGPLIALGSVAGMALARIAKLEQRESSILATAGSFSAISALFGGPLVAGVLMVEAGVGLGAALIPALLPGLVAAACGYVVFIGLGNWAGIQTTTLDVSGLPAYDGTSVPDLLLAVAIGLVTALIILAVRRVGGVTFSLRGRGVGMPALLLAGGLTVGLLALAADGLGADSQDVLFSGQSALPRLVTESSVSVIVVLIAAKALAYGVSLGCGFRGGPVFPAIFLGVAVAMLAVVWADISPTLAVAVGAAAGMAAVTHLLLASVVLATLLVGTAGVDTVPAAMLAAVAAWLVRMAADRREGAAAPADSGVAPPESPPAPAAGAG
jgi:H+/Cl- antiporter ClcA